MEGATTTFSTSEPHQPLTSLDAGQSSPFSRQWVTITKQEHIDLTSRTNYWAAQHARVKAQREMSEQLFHNDETRWDVFVDLPGKVGTRWSLWVTRSPSVIFSCIDPSRSAAVPGAQFAGLQADQAHHRL